MKVIITGSTGMVGKAALIECLESTKVASVLLSNRKSLGENHDKLKEILVSDYSELEARKEELSGYDACFHCMGISSLGTSEEEYFKVTFGLTKLLADVLFEVNPSSVFLYVSGTGTDSSEKGKIRWARVKGKTENYILNKGFKDAYALRPGVILPQKGVKSSTAWYNFFYVILKPFYPLMKTLKSVVTSDDLGKVMISLAQHENNAKYLENVDLNAIAVKSKG
jgi:nucleoside-diphosphate-sugar epimerase